MSVKSKFQTLTPPHLLTKSLESFFGGEKQKDFFRLVANFPGTWDVYVMGGLLRNMLLRKLRGLELAGHDVDLVVIGATSRQQLLDGVGEMYVSRNHFGGAKCRGPATGLILDVWRAENHVGMTETTTRPTVERLLQHNLLDVDAIAWNCRTGLLHEYGAFAAIDRAKIDLLPQGVSKSFAGEQVAHLLIVALNTGFSLSDDAQAFVRGVSREKRGKQQIIQVLRRKAPDAVDRLELLLEQFTERELV
jgi:hypothetical protein